RYWDLLQAEPMTHLERNLQAALRESKSRNESWKVQVIAMQCQSIVQHDYVGRAQSQLQGQEEKRNKPATSVFGDGMPKLLSADEFYLMAFKQEAKAEAKKEAKAQRKSQREAYAHALAEWKILNKDHLERNQQRRTQYQEEKTRWELERALAKAEGRQARWAKPKQHGIEKPIRRPKLELNAEEADKDEDESDREMDED
ncbi:hypothetical protein K474DRAFT_1604925, partial [Panus rudis PR-1116 ss-1]